MCYLLGRLYEVFIIYYGRYLMSYAFRVYVGGKRYIIRKIKSLLTTLCLAVMVLSRNFLSILESRYSVTARSTGNIVMDYAWRKSYPEHRITTSYKTRVLTWIYIICLPQICNNWTKLCGESKWLLPCTMIDSVCNCEKKQTKQDQERERDLTLLLLLMSNSFSIYTRSFD